MLLHSAAKWTAFVLISILPTLAGCNAGPAAGRDGKDDVTQPVCGNAVLEAGEECDPPDGTTCGAECLLFTNDRCGTPTAIETGTTSYSTLLMTDDGPDVADCDGDGTPDEAPQIVSDIWYCFRSPCSETVTVSLCGSQFDSKLAVYDGCVCPEGEPIACDDDGCDPMRLQQRAEESPSRVRFGAAAGREYMIRIGGYAQARHPAGPGSLAIYCTSDTDRGPSACGADAGDCETVSSDPSACDDSSCCERICSVDPFCCDVAWDQACAGSAAELCGGSFSSCGDGGDDCFAEHDSPGCMDADCCQQVCEQDVFCCVNQWDSDCLEAAMDACNP